MANRDGYSLHSLFVGGNGSESEPSERQIRRKGRGRQVLAYSESDLSNWPSQVEDDIRQYFDGSAYSGVTLTSIGEIIYQSNDILPRKNIKLYKYLLNND